jgi:isopenicillin-N N-acyltransferase like protein
MREITVCGSLSEMGEQHGEAAADLVAELFATRFELLTRQMAAAFPERPGSSIERQITGWTTDLFRQIVAQLPDVAAEVTGVSRGSGLEPWKLVVAGGYTDVLGGLVSPRHQQAACECTVVAMRAAHGGGAVIAGTWDSHASAAPALVLLRRQPASGPSTLALTTAGWSAQQGVNSAGLAFATTNLRPRHGGPGVPYIGALAQLANSTSLAEARRLLLGLGYCSGHYYPVGDEHGQLLLLETSNDDKAELMTGSDVVAHSNHYLAPDWQDENPGDEPGTNSVERLQRAETLIGGLPAESLQQRLWTILSDHGAAGSGVCRHGEGHETRSCAAFMIDAGRRSIEFTDGPACRGARHTALLHSGCREHRSQASAPSDAEG